MCAALLLGQQFLFALWYTQFGDWTTTWAFDTNLNQRTYQVQDYVQLQTDLDSGSLDYVEREQTVTLLAARFPSWGTGASWRTTCTSG